MKWNWELYRHGRSTILHYFGLSSGPLELSHDRRTRRLGGSLSPEALQAIESQLVGIGIEVFKENSHGA